MKKLSALILAILMVATLFVGCQQAPAETTSTQPSESVEPSESGSTQPSGEKFVIGFAAKGLSDPFTSMEASVYQSQSKNWEDKFEFKLLDCEFDTNKQIEVLENFINMDVDGIICQTDDPQAILPQVETCKEKGIPFINDLNLGDDWSYTVESDPQIDGELMGEFAVDWLKENKADVEKPVILFMQGEVGNQHANAREKYSKEKLTAAGYEVTDTNTANWFRDEAIALMENWCEMYDKIDAVLCANDDMSLGVVQVLEQKGRLEGTLVCSVDALAEAVKSVKDGKLTLTIGKDVFDGCDKTFNLMYDLLTGVDRSADKVIKCQKDLIHLGNQEAIDKWVDLYKSIDGWKE